ncbi:4-hydroxy-3-methylbut-2-enyl diphosphate reductase [Aquisalinus flavus]|uniref:4-hydroxy-3-methylbut-2-enyl diphosphate reductase n=1 Tax=Aquisalinus flavus TaxID=1526572 RepID=A0A8J2V1Q7_9PROT|nr:4-hydroxy-3-methylbut-2-enyl diphosphate reductase [Aquisalinus flavus]MBD0426115.1 4-hydroxy-3-methylbut-2-enyl diphosphate reductase [Aquisalinus flavus]UNE48300.1 4-hydroxy-3-methylbut-2-enyl diphosphate reductase [Aquisalinus flavus]GGD10522.1 4-hydroxy-3-methylbut-2-enyl diphosphate reductase [Aquisalinus flavus]
MKKQPLKVLLAAPRGFCAGVDRAIEIVEKALEKYGAPVYVRHEIVHNETVVSRLRDMGAVFVEELDEAPDDRPIIFSAHGVPKSVPSEAQRRNMIWLDATCPLVSKVHIETERHHSQGLEVLLIGHAGHPEVVGTLGQLPEGAITLIETEEDAETFVPRDATRLAYATQTTLSVDDTASIVAILKRRFPDIRLPHKDDICYATTNRQDAVKAIAEKSDALIVVGSQTSSNSKRLVEVGERHGCRFSVLTDSAEHLDWEALAAAQPETVGLTAGASAPESLVQGIVTALRERYDVTVEEVTTARENVTFKLPRALAS